MNSHQEMFTCKTWSVEKLHMKGTRSRYFECLALQDKIAQILLQSSVPYQAHFFMVLEPSVESKIRIMQQFQTAMTVKSTVHVSYRFDQSCNMKFKIMQQRIMTA